MTAREALLAAIGSLADTESVIKVLVASGPGRTAVNMLMLIDRTAGGQDHAVHCYLITPTAMTRAVILESGPLAEAEAHFEMAQAERAGLRPQTSCLRTDDPVRQHAMDLLLVPPVRWEGLVETSAEGSSNWQDLVSALESIAVGAARLSRYLGERYVGVVHAEAVERQNRVANKIRRVLGYRVTNDLRI